MGVPYQVMLALVAAAWQPHHTPTWGWQDAHPIGWEAHCPVVWRSGVERRLHYLHGSQVLGEESPIVCVYPGAASSSGVLYNAHWWDGACCACRSPGAHLACASFSWTSCHLGCRPLHSEGAVLAALVGPAVALPPLRQPHSTSNSATGGDLPCGLGASGTSHHAHTSCGTCTVPSA